MQGWLYIGSIAAGIVYLIWQFHKNNNNQNQPYSHRPAGSSYHEDDDDDCINIIPTTSRTRSTTIVPEDEYCPICRDSLLNKSATKKYCLLLLPCNHWLHQKCALRLLEYHPACPVCREPLNSSALRSTPVIVPKQD